jgi:predicted RND superfamily exporter protein
MTFLDPTSLAQYGLAGVCVALIGLVAWMVKIGIDFAIHYMEKHTDAINKLIAVIERLTIMIDNRK